MNFQGTKFSDITSFLNKFLCCINLHFVFIIYTAPFTWKWFLKWHLPKVKSFSERLYKTLYVKFRAKFFNTSFLQNKFQGKPLCDSISEWNHKYHLLPWAKDGKRNVCSSRKKLRSVIRKHVLKNTLLLEKLLPKFLKQAPFIAQKLKFSIKDLVTFTVEILNGKRFFVCCLPVRDEPFKRFWLILKI